jgi:hypothetical protein
MRKNAFSANSSFLFVSAAEKMAEIRIKEMSKVAVVVGTDSYIQWEIHDQGLQEHRPLGPTGQFIDVDPF